MRSVLAAHFIVLRKNMNSFYTINWKRTFILLLKALGFGFVIGAFLIVILIKAILFFFCCMEFDDDYEDSTDFGGDYNILTGEIDPCRQYDGIYWDND